MRHPARSWLGALLLTLLAGPRPDVLAQDASAPSPPLSVEEKASLEDIRAFVRAAAARYRMVAPLEVSIASWVGTGSLPQYAGTPAVYTGGALYLSRRVLRASNRDLVIAKALALEMLRAPSKASTLAERDRDRARLVREANARAVDVLVEVRGMPEEVALEEMYAWLIAIHRAALAAPRPPPPGGLSACDEIADLLRRHAGARERFAGRECAPPP
jgi:hypothetical protein